MDGFLIRIKGLSRFLNLIAGIALTFMMLLTVADIILRFLRRPIVGTYELVAFSGAVVIGFSVPLTSWMRGHVNVDFLILRFSQKTRNLIHILTRCLVIGLFLMIGWNLINMEWISINQERFLPPYRCRSILLLMEWGFVVLSSVWFSFAIY